MTAEWMAAGVLLSLLYSELTGLSPGGLIVPAYLCAYYRSPSRILSTLLIACLTFFLMKPLGRIMFLYGRRQFALSVTLSIALTFLLRALLPGQVPFHVIGYVIPGLLANAALGQGLAKTMVSTLIVSGLLFLLAAGLGGVSP